MKKKEYIFIAIILIMIVLLFFYKSSFHRKNDSAVQCKAVVTKVDNSEVKHYGAISSGSQYIELRVIGGEYKNLEITTHNILFGKMEFDRFYKKGDKVFTVLEKNLKGNIHTASIIDYYRLDYIILLSTLFIGFLLLFAGYTGLKAVLSFIFTGLVIWKILLPGFLNGYNPIIFSLIIVSILTGVIIFLIGGISRRGITAFTGAFGGILLTCLCSILFGHLFKIHGAIRPFSETLIYSGFPDLNLSSIFIAGIFISSCGAVMDIAMDVSASMDEIIEKRPDISRKELILSGFKIGKAVIGTMTTTLLFAYSGSFTTVMMVFIAQGVPELNIINIQYVASEILNTLVGSFGLVTVAPFTAIAGGFILNRK